MSSWLPSDSHRVAEEPSCLLVMLMMYYYYYMVLKQSGMLSQNLIAELTEVVVQTWEIYLLHFLPYKVSWQAEKALPNNLEFPWDLVT